jgi:hypothetical protein
MGKNLDFQPSVVIHACNPCIAATGGLQAWSCSWLHSGTLSPKKNQDFIPKEEERLEIFEQEIYLICYLLKMITVGDV